MSTLIGESEGFGLDPAIQAETGHLVMRRLRDLPLNRLHNSPNQTIGEAVAAMESAGETAIAIRDSQTLLGVLTYEAGILSEPSVPVREVMRGLHTQVQLDDAVREAARSMLEHRVDHVAVFDRAKFVGLISSITLLDELQHSWDPMTGLPWSDRLREWGTIQLALDHEISILFFDIDDFGKYNKVHGHLVGDEVIRALANRLESVVDPERDVLVRYAGDEFAIASLRNRGAAEKLLRELEPQQLVVSGVPEAVCFSVGVSGGKRQDRPSRVQESASEHVQSTLDNLINLASRACTANKNARKASRVETAPADAVRVEKAQISTGSTPNAKVTLVLGSQTARGEFSSNGTDRLSVVATATATAYESIFLNSKVTIDDAIVYRNADGLKVVSVVGRLQRGEVTHPLTGTQAVGEDVVRATAEALCNGLNAIR